MQLTSDTSVDGSEDCLYLNVTAPAGSAAAARLPVMVHLHGGSNWFGRPYKHAAALVQRGVIVVTVGYRLGTFGFVGHPALSAEGGGSSGEYGVLDQIAALTWVRDNIAAFGGDASQVTICGESAGAMGVTTLTAMPAARALFHRVIAQSGAGHHVIGTDTADKIAAALADLLGVEPTAEAFAGVAMVDLLAAHDRLTEAVGLDPNPERWGEVAANAMPFEPVVDGDSLTGKPYDVVAAGDGADVDVLIGTNDDEHALFLYPVIDAVDEERVRLVLALFGAADGAYETYVDDIGSKRPGDVMIAGLTDWFFRLPALRLAEDLGSVQARVGAGLIGQQRAAGTRVRCGRIGDGER